MVGKCSVHFKWQTSIRQTDGWAGQAGNLTSDGITVHRGNCLNDERLVGGCDIGKRGTMGDEMETINEKHIKL